MGAGTPFASPTPHIPKRPFQPLPMATGPPQPHIFKPDSPPHPLAGSRRAPHGPRCPPSGPGHRGGGSGGGDVGWGLRSLREHLRLQRRARHPGHRQGHHRRRPRLRGRVSPCPNPPPKQPLISHPLGQLRSHKKPQPQEGPGCKCKSPSSCQCHKPKPHKAPGTPGSRTRMPRPPLKWALCVPPPLLSPGKGRGGFRIPERIAAGCLSLPREVSGVPEEHDNGDMLQPKKPQNAPKYPPGGCGSGEGSC